MKYSNNCFKALHMLKNLQERAKMRGIIITIFFTLLTWVKVRSDEISPGEQSVIEWYINEARTCIAAKANESCVNVDITIDDIRTESDARNMIEVAWSIQLAAAAQDVVDRYKIDSENNDIEMIELFPKPTLLKYIGRNVKSGQRKIFREFIISWIKPYLTSLHDPSRVNDKKDIEHSYRTIVWADNPEVGCGYKFIDEGDDELFFCYFRQTNLGPEKPYVPGLPSCKEFGLTPSTEYVGLCRGFPVRNKHTGLYLKWFSHGLTESEEKSLVVYHTLAKLCQDQIGEQGLQSKRECPSLYFNSENLVAPEEEYMVWDENLAVSAQFAAFRKCYGEEDDLKDLRHPISTEIFQASVTESSDIISYANGKAALNGMVLHLFQEDQSFPNKNWSRFGCGYAYFLKTEEGKFVKLLVCLYGI